MTTRIFLRLLAAASVAVGALAIFLTPAHADSMTENFTVVERATSDAVLDLGAKDDSAGDILTYANDVYDEANTTKVGSDNGWCMRTVAGKAWECVATLTLADGQITGEGPFYDGLDSVWAVTGGTGKYAGVRGDMGLHARNKEGTEYDFKFNLIK